MVNVRQDSADKATNKAMSAAYKYAAMQALQAAGVPAGAVLSVRDLTADPQLEARGFFEEVTHADAGTWRMEGPAWRLEKHPAHIRLPAPRFAEHNDYVFRALLGLGEADLAALEREGVIGTEPNLQTHV